MELKVDTLESTCTHYIPSYHNTITAPNTPTLQHSNTHVSASCGRTPSSTSVQPLRQTPRR